MPRRGNVYDVRTLTAAGIVVAFLRPTNYLTTNGTSVEVPDNAFIRNNVVVSSPTQSSVALVGGVSTVGIYVHSKSTLHQPQLDPLVELAPIEVGARGYCNHGS